MGYNQNTTSNSGTPVGNNWMQMLNSGLQGGGQFSYPQNPQTGYGPNKAPFTNPDGTINSRPRAPTSGGMGAPGADPYGAMNQTGMQTNQTNNALAGGGAGNGMYAPPTGSNGGGGIAGVLNRGLNSNPSQMYYNDPNNPRPAGYNPTQVGVTPQGTGQAINNLMTANPGMQFNNPGASDLFNQAQQQMFNYQGQTQQNPFGSASMPGAPGVGSFSSQGILGDRSNVTSAITNAANLQSQQALAAQNARFTAMGGMSGGTPAAYATAQTNAQQGVGLANALAQADINYRNLDLGGYQAQNQANSANFGTQGQMYGAQLNRLNSIGNTGVSALQNVAGNEFGQQNLGLNYGQLNLNSGLGFGSLNNQAFTNAGNMGISAAGLQQQGQQYNNQNAYNAAGLNQQGWGMQGNMDLTTQGQGYQNQQNFVNQLFNSYNNAYNHGTPQAGTTYTPNTGQNILNAVPGIVSAATPFLRQFGGGGGGGMPNHNVPNAGGNPPDTTGTWYGDYQPQMSGYQMYNGGMVS